ncbi:MULTISPECIES: sugar ABC transporter substrate-binding protein [unclassified Serratia (in: enterobacteria)]|uniref:ABC transporter substrate-binding protein n=1 Tax=unclassified Serratia (in: enterobacteria) TaxID=2647522 RepID=UPI000502F6B3|nr:MULTISPECIES: sugar ABC transporter substrate-binding protein [unclassified Serratia (in: enterobacteria)]KFK96407.1 sugar ABC transporter substrate-binding protein [Serratia sp. Ag2]KFK99882.1 sugar ABC transporter substrate-binding protein [Serratia sp. Ag1]
MSVTKIKSLLLLSVLGLGAAQAYAEETLNIWIRASNDSKNIYKKEAETFEKKTGIKIEYFNATTDFEQRLARAAAGNALPDLIFNDAVAIGQFIQLGIADEIDPQSIAGHDNIYPLAWQSTRYTDGKYYGVPTSAQTFALFVRKDWREKLGMPPPKTWEDVAKLAKAFTTQDPDGNGKADTYGFILPASTTRGYASWFMSAFLWQAGGDFMRESAPGKFKAALDEPAAVETLQFMRGMLCDKVVQPGAINATTADVIPSFRSSQSGMFFSGPYHIALFDKDPGKDTFEVVSLQGPKSQATLAEGTTVFLMKSSQKKEAARKFIEFMISQEGQEIGMGKGSSNIPVVRLPVNKLVDTQAVYNDPRWATFATLYAEQGRYVPQVPNWTPIRQITAEGFNRILADCNGDIAAELQATHGKVNAELEKQGVLAK